MPASNDSLSVEAGCCDTSGDGTASVKTVAIVSLGCPKNLVDSEKMLGLLAESGLVPTADESWADAIIVNTCGFLAASMQEGLDEIARAAQFKTTGACKRLVVAGCLVQRHRAKILDHCAEIDAMIGVFDRDHIVQAVTGRKDPRQDQLDLDVDQPIYSSIAPNAVVAKRRRGIDAPGYFEDDRARLRLTPRHYTYLRISEGCNQNCTFCTIPSIRGKLRSKPVDRVTNELRQLIGDGAFEINLIGQDTTSYGTDIGYAGGLAALLEAINKTTAQETGPAGGWIRLMYAYPSCFTDEMIDCVARLEHIVKYIDMPLQHINDRVLARMRRNTDRRLIESLLEKLRRRVPGVAIRTTLITGFPGESDAQHQELVRFVQDFGFEAMGVFRYSPEPGTPAGTLAAAGQAVPAEVVDQRYDELMSAQQSVAFAKNARWSQRRDQFDVLVEGVATASDDGDQEVDTDPTSQGSGRYFGRTYFQAPQIDGATIIHSPAVLAPGELIRCQITGYEGYDLVAQPVETRQGLSLPVLAGTCDTH